MQEKIYLALLHSIGFTHKKLSVIFEHDQSYQEFYENIKSYDLKKFWIKSNEVSKIMKNYELLTLESIVKLLNSRDVEVVTYFDQWYPEGLKNIANPPFVLYVRWKISESPKLGVVWSRKITSYGSKVIHTIVPEISRYFEIVSGWAYWCDTEAHNACLDAKNITVAVIWTSILEDYPVWNEGMYNQIVETGGAVVSIFPIGVPWSAYNFPVRNEIVVGLSNGIVVVEAQERSGSLITANLALDMWKDLFSIPGDVYKQNSIWCNNLIKTWQAKLTTCSGDILEEYNISKNIWKVSEWEVKEDITFESELEKKIYDALKLESLTSDDLVQKLQSDISTLSLSLSLLEIKWVIQKNLWGMYEVK